VVAAYVLIQTTIGVQERVAGELSRIPGVDRCAVVAGPYDVVARLVADDVDALGRIVLERVHALAGVARTITCAVVQL
jgi:DNA-binding Lrp family transcriptional regulator